jgi:hypothetical protein
MRIFLAVIIILGVASCKYQNEEDYFAKPDPNLEDCNPTYVSFSEHIKPAFDYQCTYCHMNEMVPGCDLDTYENTISYVNRTGTLLYDYVKDNTHQGATLDSCQLKQLSKWVINPAP